MMLAFKYLLINMKKISGVVYNAYIHCHAYLKRSSDVSSTRVTKQGYLNNDLGPSYSAHCSITWIKYYLSGSRPCTDKLPRKESLISSLNTQYLNPFQCTFLFLTVSTHVSKHLISAKAIVAPTPFLKRSCVPICTGSLIIFCLRNIVSN